MPKLSIAQMVNRRFRKQKAQTLFATIVIFFINGAVFYALAGFISAVFSFQGDPFVAGSEMAKVFIKVILIWAIMGSITGVLVGLEEVRAIDLSLPLRLKITNVLFITGVLLGCFSSVVIAWLIYPQFQCSGVIMVRPAILRVPLSALLGFFILKPLIEISMRDYKSES